MEFAGGNAHVCVIVVIVQNMYMWSLPCLCACITAIYRDCNLGKKGYVFAATSAAEIATIVNERRARVCRLRPDTATPTSVHPFPPAKSPHTNEGAIK